MRPFARETVTARLDQGVSPAEVSVDAAGLDARLTLPETLGGVDRPGSTNPEQLFGGAYAGCFAFALEYVGRRAGADLSGLTCTAEVAVGRGRSGANDLEVVLTVDLPALDQTGAEELCRQATRYCPFHRAVAPTISPTTIVRAGATR